MGAQAEDVNLNNGFFGVNGILMFIIISDGSTSSSRSGWHWITLKRQQQPRKDQSPLAVLMTTPASLTQLMLQS